MSSSQPHTSENHTPLVIRNSQGDWKPACSCGWKISEGWWTRKSAEQRTLTHCGRARMGWPA